MQTATLFIRTKFAFSLERDFRSRPFNSSAIYNVAGTSRRFKNEKNKRKDEKNNMWRFYKLFSSCFLFTSDSIESR